MRERRENPGWKKLGHPYWHWQDGGWCEVRTHGEWQEDRNLMRKYHEDKKDSDGSKSVDYFPFAPLADKMSGDHARSRMKFTTLVSSSRLISLLNTKTCPSSNLFSAIIPTLRIRLSGFFFFFCLFGSCQTNPEWECQRGPLSSQSSESRTTI